MLDGLCQRWGCPPLVILEQPADLVLDMLNILEEAGELTPQIDEKGKAPPAEPEIEPKLQALAEASEHGR